MATKTADKPVISPAERSEFDSMTSSENFSKSAPEPTSSTAQGGGQQQRGGRLRKFGQQVGGGAKGAVKGAAKGAAKEGLKEGAKGAANGAVKGARAGATAGSAVPVVGTAIGGALGGIGGAIGGGALGATKGAAKGGLKGAREGAREGVAKAKDKNRQKYTDKGIKDAQNFANGTKKMAGKGANAAAGAATGVNAKDIKESIQAAKDMAGGPMSKRAWQGAAKLGKKWGSKAAAYAIGNPELAKVFEKAADIVTNRKFWIVIISLGLLLFFMVSDESTFDAPNTNATADTPTTSDTCNPAQFTGDAFGQTAVCTITVTYDGSAQDITIIDTILPGTNFVSAGQKGTYDPTSKTVTWDMQQLNPSSLNPVNITVTVTVSIATHQVNTIVYNAYDINPVGLSGSTNGNVAIPGNLPPNSNTCSGIYSAYMAATPGHQNYGDPTCSLVKKDPNGVAIINKDAILAELKTLKPSEAMGWFICVIPNESSYNANAYLAASTSGRGAYGLVQMNPTGQGNGTLDDGEVVWPLQLSNGINYNDTKIGHTFSYWPTSYDSCLRSYGVTVN